MAKGKAKDAAAGARGAKKGAKPAKRAKVKAKPKGMRWVNPYLRVRDVAEALAWYEKAFGFKTTFVMRGEDGRPVHAEMRHRKSVIMMGAPRDAGASREAADAKEGAPPVSLYCYCDDVDAVAASARLAGARVVEEPADKFYGDRTCLLIDPDGHSWAFATHKFDMVPDAAPPHAPKSDPDKTETMPAAGRAGAAAVAPEPARAGAAGPG